MSDEAEVGPGAIAQIKACWGSHDAPFYGPESRTISINGAIDQETGNSFISQLLELDSCDEGQPIIVHLNTEGGSLVDAFAMYDMIKSITSPVIMIVMGGCMSAGLLILSAADVRIATPNSLFFYHQVIMDGVSLESGEHVREMSTYYTIAQKAYDEAVRTRSKITPAKWKREFTGRTSKFFSSAEALELGVIDHMFEYSKKPKIKMGDK